MARERSIVDGKGGRYIGERRVMVCGT